MTLSYYGVCGAVSHQRECSGHFWFKSKKGCFAAVDTCHVRGRVLEEGRYDLQRGPCGSLPCLRPLLGLSGEPGGFFRIEPRLPGVCLLEGLDRGCWLRLESPCLEDRSAVLSRVWCFLWD